MGVRERLSFMKWTGVITIGLLISACASATTDTTTTVTPTDPDTVVVTIIDEGGCFMMGPNCPTYVVHADGTVELVRTGGTGEVEATTTVDVELVDTIRALVATTDLETLRSTLPEGELTAAYDGVDTTFVYGTPDGEVGFSGAVVELVESEPLFAATWKVRRLTAASIELPLETRP